MKDIEVKGMISAHAIIAAAVLLATLLPVLLVQGFSVYGTHLLWLYSVCGAVASVNITIYWLLGVSPPSKKNTLSSKLNKAFLSCLYFVLSCLLFHAVVVLYGAPLLESALETFSFAVLLSTLTTLRCLCLLGPNVQAWIRVFSRDGCVCGDVGVGHQPADHHSLQRDRSLARGLPHSPGLGPALAGLAHLLHSERHDRLPDRPGAGAGLDPLAPEAADVQEQVGGRRREAQTGRGTLRCHGLCVLVVVFFFFVLLSNQRQVCQESFSFLNCCL
ncbi:phosphatidylinositol-glycan biosynthesis class F protein isoform X1 [Amia ocellicauda]|uniref:phosphatidylinositol-glycan biosynthesis class F protein isoform X1 n=1 Tax=Amia ocellicauda TaxID=2972642 RepID=UPI003463D133